MKKCFKCLKDLPVFEFYRHPKMDDGYLGKCKSCTKLDVASNREKNIDKIRAYDRSRGHRGGPVWESKHPEERRAQRLVGSAIRNGSLKSQPCSVCGNLKAVAHHDDYSKPLEVIWLCQIHHRARHKMLREKGVDVYGSK